jgi:hypothetical protein
MAVENIPTGLARCGSYGGGEQGTATAYKVSAGGVATAIGVIASYGAETDGHVNFNPGAQVIENGGRLRIVLTATADDKSPANTTIQTAPISGGGTLNANWDVHLTFTSNFSDFAQMALTDAVAVSYASSGAVFVPKILMA